MSSTEPNSNQQTPIKARFKLKSSDEPENTIEFRSGFLNRKRIFEANGKPTGKGRRGWRRVQVTLRNLKLSMQPALGTDAQDPINSAKEQAKIQTSANGQRHDSATIKSTTLINTNKRNHFQLLARNFETTYNIYHSFAKKSTNYAKSDNVFHLRLADQSEFLLQANSEQDLKNWVDSINFASACLSAPVSQGAICRQNETTNKSNVNGGIKRSRLRQSISAATAKLFSQSTYTKLFYWEQLINHEERLQRLKQELDGHLSEASSLNQVRKLSKSEFIDKIAYLKQEIERYSVYVELMRRKSNSPEAIVMSKHPQIASLTPSLDMIKSLPSYAPVQVTAIKAKNS